MLEEKEFLVRYLRNIEVLMGLLVFGYFAYSWKTSTVDFNRLLVPLSLAPYLIPILYRNVLKLPVHTLFPSPFTFYLCVTVMSLLIWPFHQIFYFVALTFGSLLAYPITWLEYTHLLNQEIQRVNTASMSSFHPESARSPTHHPSVEATQKQAEIEAVLARLHTHRETLHTQQAHTWRDLQAIHAKLQAAAEDEPDRAAWSQQRSALLKVRSQQMLLWQFLERAIQHLEQYRADLAQLLPAWLHVPEAAEIERIEAQLPTIAADVPLDPDELDLALRTELRQIVERLREKTR